jgi:hypothetical protein
MAPEREPLSVVPCPPHHWLIERTASRIQHWTCQRCGTQQDHDDNLKFGYHWVDQRTKHKKDLNPLHPRAAS